MVTDLPKGSERDLRCWPNICELKGLPPYAPHGVKGTTRFILIHCVRANFKLFCKNCVSCKVLGTGLNKAML